MSKPFAVTDDTFEEEVIKATLPVLVDFWAPWCAPCLMIAPILEDTAAEYEGRLKVVKVNVDENRRLASQFGIMSIPTLILFKDGQAVERLVGILSKKKLLDKIAPHLE